MVPLIVCDGVLVPLLVDVGDVVEELDLVGVMVRDGDEEHEGSNVRPVVRQVAKHAHGVHGDKAEVAFRYGTPE